MKIITKHTDYAIRALIQLAKNGETFQSADSIAKKEGISRYFLRRLLSECIKAELIYAKEGAGGGLKLQKSPDTITLYDIIKLYQGDLTFTDCRISDKFCQNLGTCLLKKEITQTENLIKKRFASITITSLLQGS
jgi:Rrf2 family protein